MHLSDYPAGWIHLGTAARLSGDVGDDHLVCWSLDAQSMVAGYQHRYPEALDLARHGLEHTTTLLTRAQLLAWAARPWPGSALRTAPTPSSSFSRRGSPRARRLRPRVDFPQSGTLR